MDFESGRSGKARTGTAKRTVWIICVWKVALKVLYSLPFKQAREISLSYLYFTKTPLKIWEAGGNLFFFLKKRKERSRESARMSRLTSGLNDVYNSTRRIQ